MAYASSALFSSIPRLIVSAESGGGGKTLVSLGLTRAFTKLGFAVKAFKKGPDYIDAAWLGHAARFPATNLDLFFLDQAQIQKLFLEALSLRLNKEPKILAIVEGNRGLFDGLDRDGSCSTSELARDLCLPILLTLDCTKATRTMAAIVEGIVNFEDGLEFAGLILNRVGTKRQEELLRQVLEHYTGLPVLGVLPRLHENLLPERHMGLASFGHMLSVDLDLRLDKISQFIGQNVDLEALLSRVNKLRQQLPKHLWPEAIEIPSIGSKSLATFFSLHGTEDEDFGPQTSKIGQGCAADLGPKHAPFEHNLGDQAYFTNLEIKPKPTLAVVLDKSLWFYYPENWQALDKAGANLRFISLLDDFERFDGLYLGGGFPEDFAQDLSQSASLAKIKKLALDGLPIYAECGGFMVLAKSLEVAGIKYPMANVFDVDVQFCPKPQGLGYIRGEIITPNPYFPKGSKLKGHEFHYSKCHWQGEPKFAIRLTRGQGMGIGANQNYDGLVFQNVWASYTHIWAESYPNWAKNFVAQACQYAVSRRLNF
ncbi:MAG: cobyrinate a,c-diamide synthase [Desulfovibrionaceae bacterium]|nr:cobyrinate a,c-diamide synthase [Desulfovibrionaceae bacterium]